MNNLYEQMDTAGMHALGLLVGVDNVSPSFRNYLREVPALHEGFTIGDAATAYLVHRIATLIRSR
jgi:hypothetical protein